MAIRKSFLIVLFIVCLTIHDTNSIDWKFWKKDKETESTTTTTTTTTTTIAPSVVKLSTVKPPVRGTINKGIANAADPSLIIGIGQDGNTIKNNAKPKYPNPGTEVGQDFPNSRPGNQGIGGSDSKGYRDWAVDLTGAGEPVNLNPKAPGSSPTPASRPPIPNSAQKRPDSSISGGIAATGTPTGGQRPPVASSTPGNLQNNNQKPLVVNPTPGKGPVSGQNPSVAASGSGNGPISGQRPPIAASTPGNGPISGQRPPIAASTPGNGPISGQKSSVVLPIPGNNQKPTTVAPPSPTSGKSWAEIAGGGSRPGSPIPTPSPPRNQANVQVRPASPYPTRSPTSSAVIYSENPVYSKGNTVTDEDLIKLSEALFIKDKNNAWKHISLNLQKKTSSSSKVDEAKEPLLTVNSAALQIPTIEKVLKIYDNYHLDTTEKEQISPLQRDEEALLVDTFLSTNVMSAAMRFLADKGFMKRDYYEYKFLLRQIWFSLYSRGEGKIGSSGFEHVFMTELKLGTEVSGLHNWIYFNAEEVKKRADYLGYMEKLELGDKAAILKFHAKFNGFDKPVTSMFIGTSPELEMALYTICFYTRPDQTCKMQMGGKKFDIITHKFRYRGKDVIGSAYPEI